LALLTKNIFDKVCSLKLQREETLCIAQNVIVRKKLKVDLLEGNRGISVRIAAVTLLNPHFIEHLWMLE
jgi:hypothetical protein